jgi:hypothetical protein
MTEIHTLLDTTLESNEIPQIITLKGNLPMLPQKSSSILHATSVEAVLKEKVTDCGIEEEDPFYVADMSDVIHQFSRWKSLLPRVRPYYGKSLLI